MRSALLAIVALSVSAPAFAADTPSRATIEAQDMAAKLNSPIMQRTMTGALDAMLAALLDVRVDGIAKALEPINGGKKIDMHGRTVREIAERDDPNFEGKMHRSTKAAVGGMGALAAGLAAAMPELEAAMAKMGDAMKTAQDRMPDTN
ncbi:MAG: hypothetical protein ABL918_10350 [Chakrabartia sp.]